MLDVSEQDDRWRVFYVKEKPVSFGGMPLKKEGAPYDGINNYVEQWRKHFQCFNDMPRKTREGVACLSMCANGEKLKGVGQRVSEKTYWLDSTHEVLSEYD